MHNQFFNDLDKGLKRIQYHNLSPEFISDFLFYFRKTDKTIKSNPGEKVSLAIAFANLYLSDPSDVTEHHKKILKKEFNGEEITELTLLIQKELNQG